VSFRRTQRDEDSRVLFTNTAFQQIDSSLAARIDSSVNNNNNGLQIRSRREILRTCLACPPMAAGLTAADGAYILAPGCRAAPRRTGRSGGENKAPRCGGPAYIRAPIAPQWCPPALPSGRSPQPAVSSPHRRRTVNVRASSDLWRMRLKLDGNELSDRFPTCVAYIYTQRHVGPLYL